MTVNYSPPPALADHMLYLAMKSLSLGAAVKQDTAYAQFKFSLLCVLSWGCLTNDISPPSAPTIKPVLVRDATDLGPQITYNVPRSDSLSFLSLTIIDIRNKDL